jgi:uncharacterized membrane protein YhaH (DUF805 family)
MNFVNLFISPSGRINRAKFWIVVLCTVVFFLSVIGISMAVSGSMTTVFGAALIAYIPMIYVGVVNAIKRLHDRNKSGWWVLLFYGAPLVLPLVAALVDGGTDTSVGLLLLQLVSLIISVWALVELGCLKGTIGQNKYGPDPLAPDVLTPPVRTHA